MTRHALCCIVLAALVAGCSEPAVNEAPAELSAAECASARAWSEWTPYAVGAAVSFAGATYQCIQAHTSQPGWTPSAVPALWQPASCAGGAGPTPTPTPTAKIAIEASLTGHLVLSTLHTNNAAESVVRLLDLGISPFHFADSLVGIVAQRLVRLLCRQCSVPRSLGPGQFDRLVAAYVEQSPLSVEEGRQRLLEAAGVARPEDVVVSTAKGCEACNGSGYRGRIGVYEVLESNPAIRSLIQAKARPTEIFDTAVLAGMRSLRHDALEKMVSGRIDLQQAKSAYL